MGKQRYIIQFRNTKGVLKTLSYKTFDTFFKAMSCLLNKHHRAETRQIMYRRKLTTKNK